MSDEMEPVEDKKFEKKLRKIIPKYEEEKLRVFQFNDKKGEYQELVLEEEVQLNELLDSDFILLFVDPDRYRVWIWQGSNTTTRMKFISAKTAPQIRDRYGIAYKISSVDEGNETTAFKVMVGLEEPEKIEDAQKGPAYLGKEEDLELLAELSREKIVLILEKAGIPEGYERKLVIVKNRIYGYKEFEKNYMGSVIKEKKLFPLKDEVDDGSYLAEDYIPRILFSFNNVVLTELLQKTNGKEEKN
ncbi:MAG: hypothetical protein EU539_08590 [Promethearchaeota archaeon]|nr:MAG: hypothetical protein EU539_08590 [Candidatus Lokiarchaeota archaeon]